MKNIMLVMFAVFSFALLGACTNTLDGVGQDISKAGEKIQDTF